MKLLSIAVPCYNSQDYMRNCVDSLLKGGELVEILIVNDGSKDDTAKIADEYAEKYPTIVRVIHQENGGHGEAVNTGIRNATGFYFKVVDSDDWVNEEAFEAILKKLQELIAGPQTLDMMISNFVYEKQATSDFPRIIFTSHSEAFHNSFGNNSVYINRCIRDMVNRI